MAGLRHARFAECRQTPAGRPAKRPAKEVALYISGLGNHKPACSCLPYRDLIRDMALDPALRPLARQEFADRSELHEVLREQAGVGDLFASVTYRLSPDCKGYFNQRFAGSGPGGSYTAVDKVRYLCRRAVVEGWYGKLLDDQQEEGPELPAGDGLAELIEDLQDGVGYTPSDAELLTLAARAGVDPRFFFEDSEKDLRMPDISLRSAKDPRRRLWRLEGAVSPALGNPIEMFEKCAGWWPASALNSSGTVFWRESGW